MLLNKNLLRRRLQRQPQTFFPTAGLPPAPVLPVFMTSGEMSAGLAKDKESKQGVELLSPQQQISPVLQTPSLITAVGTGSLLDPVWHPPSVPLIPPSFGAALKIPQSFNIAQDSDGSSSSLHLPGLSNASSISFNPSVVQCPLLLRVKLLIYSI